MLEGRSVLRGLTPREQEILELVAAGYTSAEIARRLHRSVRTIELHRLKIGRVLNAKNPTDLIQKARRAGLIDSDPGTDSSGRASNATSVEEMLDALSRAASSSEDGQSLLSSICKQMVLAFGASNAVICRVTSRGEVHSVASWSHNGAFVLPAWNFHSSPCARLRWGEVITIPFHDLPNGMAKSFGSICDDGSSLTIIPLRREVEKHLGVLCLTHEKELDLTSLSKPILILCSAWISSELCKTLSQKGSWCR